MAKKLSEEQKVRDQAVVKAYQRLDNGRAVAREFGIHENTVYQILKRHRGVCLRCQEPAAPGKSLCPDHLKYERKRINDRRKERRRSGLCQDCDEVVDPPSRTYCKVHRLRHIDDNRRYDRKRSELRGSPQGQASSCRQKLRHIRDKYGEAAVVKFEGAKGCCEVDSSPYGEVVIHIHHIDCDEHNHAPENLSVLCFDCHTAVHALAQT